MNASPAFGSLAALIGVIALIPLALWLLKRTPLGGGAAHGPMRLVGTLALGPSQRLVTVEVGSGDERRWLVLSVGPSGVTTLHTMEPSQGEAVAAAPAAAAGTVVPGFAKLFAAHRAAVSAKPSRHDASAVPAHREPTAHQDAA